jgi:uncharacterized protein YbjT (DUF2867 family)
VRTEPVLVTGATGYVGGRLVPRLLQSGHRVRAVARNMDKLMARPWARHPLVEPVQGDVMDVESLTKACQGCWAAYYLVHSMHPQVQDFAKTDREAAQNMVKAAADSGLDRIIYLGGLVPEGQELSHHLASRMEVGRILQSGPVPTTILRAAMILGSGSASFEIMRYLVDRLPIMVTPRWVRTKVQPICIRNVIGYLDGCLEHDRVKGETFDICGPEVLTYEDLFQMYAQEAGLRKRWIIALPILTPTLSSYWIHLITPVHQSIARPLAEGLRNTVVCGDNRIRQIIPQDLMDCRRTIKRIMFKRQQQLVETTWTDAGGVIPQEWVHTGDAQYAGGTVINAAYRMRLLAEPQDTWAPLIRIGGETGWYFADFLWKLRGRLDEFFGGVGGRRGRRHTVDLAVGDALDFWRVVGLEAYKRLLLVAEMKAPGEVVLDFRLIPMEGGETELQMIGRFLPRGLWGLAYWYFLLPFHIWIFRGVLKSIAQRINKPITFGPKPFNPKPVLESERSQTKELK